MCIYTSTWYLYLYIDNLFSALPTKVGDIILFEMMKLEHEQKDILSFLSAKCENGAESLEGLGGRILSLASDTMLCRRGGRSAEKSSEARFQTATEAAS